MKKLMLIISLIHTLQITNAQTPFFTSGKIKNIPLNYQKPHDNLSIYENQKKSNIPWIVYSDRDENTTYTQPGGNIALKKINFLDKFYVVEEDNGYLKLIQYDGPIKNNKVLDKRNVESYGWISKSKLLLWNRSFLDNDNGYSQKSISIITNIKPLINAEKYFDKEDSVLVYSSPLLKQKIAKIQKEDYVYIYKKSEDGNQYLIGTDENLAGSKTSKNIYGWIASDLVHKWGTRLYVNRNSYDELNHLEIAHSNNYKLLENHPIINKNNNTITLGSAQNIFNKENNSVITLNGSILTYTEYQNLKNNRNKINIVFVIDGSNSMKKYYPGLINTIKNLENVFKNSDENEVKYASVVYRSSDLCLNKGTSNSEFSNDYNKTIEFLLIEKEHTESCINDITDQPIVNGFDRAIQLFDSTTSQTNLIVLIGSTGNINGINADLNNQLSKKLAAVDARVLAIQMYSDYSSTYNNFVIESRKLISETAKLTSEIRKGKAVIGEGLINTNNFNVTFGDSISYYLDYPKNSLIQGGVVFPTKGSFNSNQNIRTSVKRFYDETNFDIKTHITSLDSAFRKQGISTENIHSNTLENLKYTNSLKFKTTLPHNDFKYFNTLNVSSDTLNQIGHQLKYSIIVNNAEYNQIIELSNLIVGNNLNDQSKNYRSQLYKNYIFIAENLINKPLRKSTIKRMTLHDYFENVIGLPINEVVIKNTLVRDLKNNRKMNNLIFEDYLSHLKSSFNKIKELTQTEQKFKSNGNTYYFITQNNFNKNEDLILK